MNKDTTNTEHLCSLEEQQLSSSTLPYQILSIAQQDALLRCNLLSSTTKLVWQYLHNHSDYHSKKVVYNLKRLSHFFNVSTKTIKRSVEQLITHRWIKATKYSRQHGGPEEFQILMPRDVFDTIIQGKHRKESTRHYENSQRQYHKDVEGNILLTTYENANGTKTLILGETLDIKDIVALVKTHIVDGSPANDDSMGTAITETFKATEKPVLPESKRLSSPVEAAEKNRMAEIEETWSQSTNTDLTTQERYACIEKARQLSARTPRVDKNVHTPVIKYIPQITKQNKTLGPDVHVKPQQVPERYRAKVLQALTRFKHTISHPAGLLNEMLYAISKQFVGQPKDRSNPTIDDIMRYNTDVAIKLVRLNQWTTPAQLRNTA